MRRNKQLEERVYKALQDRYIEKRNKLHVSDVVYCLRKAFYRRTTGRPPTKKQLVWFLLGEISHKILQELGWEYKEYEISKDGLVGHIDIYDSAIIIEVKTTRKLYRLQFRKDVPETWMRQIMAYAYMLNKTEVDLLVVYDVLATIESYHLKFTEKELEDNWNYLLKRKEILEKALETGVVNGILPETEYKWECRDCEFRDICKRW